MNRIKEAEVLRQSDLPQRLRERIIEKGEISPDGVILRFKELNRDGPMDLIKATADYMAGWIRSRFGRLDREEFKIAVVDSSGRDLASFLTLELGIERTVIKKGQPATMFGEILSENIHSFTRQTPTILCVEKKDIAGRKLICVDDFAASGDTLEAVEKMAQKAGGELVAIAVAVSKPGQGSEKIMRRIPSLSVVTIEKMTPARGAEQAKIKFIDMPEQALKRRWGEG